MISKEGYMEIKAMYRNGMTVRAISRKLGLHRNTVKKHLMSDDFPRYHKTRRRESILEPYTPMIRDYLQEDDYRATWILERIRRAGYPGAYGMVRDYVRTIKQHKTRLAYVRFETEPGRQSQFDWADFLVENGDARYITRDEAKAIVRLSEKEGLVNVTSNSTESVDFICSCCSCCCGALTVMNYFPSPSRELAGNYQCHLDVSLCIKEKGCTACVVRCQAFAHKIVDGDVQFNQKLCIGCGLCISACPTNALRLVIKPEGKINKPPKTMMELLKRVETERREEI
jgi:NAD-dependent dihydropyrimidine dehydrogenase PreA subunit